MGYDPDRSRHDQIIDGPVVEYLGCQPARNDQFVLAVLSFRFFPATSFACRNFSLTQAQILRLRDDLHSLLTTPGSWLFIEKE